MQTYASHVPTCFDRHISLEDRETWLIAPVTQTRDSGPLDLSNFAACLKALGGESDTVEVHRFGHWGPGWYEIIIVDPADSERVQALEEITAALENYPVLNDEDFSAREHADYVSGWNDCGQREFIRALAMAFKQQKTCLDESGIARPEFDSDGTPVFIRLADTTTDFLEDCDSDKLMEFFESCIPSGEYYTSYNEGVSIRTDTAARNCTRDKLAAFIREQRNS